MLATDTCAECRLDVASLVDGNLDELSHTFLVEHLERIDLEDLLFQVDGEEGGDIVARVAEGHLREVVGTEGEVVGLLGNLVGHEGSTRDLDHRTYLEVELETELVEHFTGALEDDSLLLTELGSGTDERHHDLGMGIVTLLLQLAGSGDDGAGLHGRDLGGR